jgi:hypothetical protein
MLARGRPLECMPPGRVPRPDLDPTLPCRRVPADSRCRRRCGVAGPIWWMGAVVERPCYGRSFVRASSMDGRKKEVTEMDGGPYGSLFALRTPPRFVRV